MSSAGHEAHAQSKQQPSLLGAASTGTEQTAEAKLLSAGSEHRCVLSYVHMMTVHVCNLHWCLAHTDSHLQQPIFTGMHDIRQAYEQCA